MWYVWSDVLCFSAWQCNWWAYACGVPGERYPTASPSVLWWRGNYGVGLFFRGWAWPLAHGTLNASACKDIFDNAVLPKLWQQFVDGPLIFQHDCASAPKAKSIKTRVSMFGVEKLDWSWHHLTTSRMIYRHIKDVSLFYICKWNIKM